MFGQAYQGKTVLVTGHTGFKGSWLCLWLEQLGANVVGYALDPPTTPALFDQAGVASGIADRRCDVRDAAALARVVAEVRPDFVFHLAAQPLVLDSYAAPAETFATNVTGTINLLEALRAAGRPVAVVMVTTDKVYRNLETGHAFAEDDPLGGHDPYSASKAAMEIAIASWRNSYFAPARLAEHGIAMAAARAGNVIGGGDWAANRLVPDLARALAGNAPVRLRHPGALRPWQHVLEPLAGYLRLGALLAGADAGNYTEAWNLGPHPEDIRPVGALAEAVLDAWGRSGWEAAGADDAPHEAGLLRLSIDKALARLGWAPTWDFAETVTRTAAWYRTVLADPGAARAACLADLDSYAATGRARGMAWAA